MIDVGLGVACGCVDVVAAALSRVEVDLRSGDEGPRARLGEREYGVVRRRQIDLDHVRRRIDRFVPDVVEDAVAVLGTEPRSHSVWTGRGCPPAREACTRAVRQRGGAALEHSSGSIDACARVVSVCGRHRDVAVDVVAVYVGAGAARRSVGVADDVEGVVRCIAEGVGDNNGLRTRGGGAGGGERVGVRVVRRCAVGRRRAREACVRDRGEVQDCTPAGSLAASLREKSPVVAGL